MQANLFQEGDSLQYHHKTKNIKSPQIDEQKLLQLVDKTGLKRQAYQKIINNMKGKQFEYTRLMILLIKYKIPLQPRQFIYIIGTIHEEMLCFLYTDVHYIGRELFQMLGIQSFQELLIMEKLSSEWKYEASSVILNCITHINFPNLMSLNMQRNCIVSIQSIGFMNLPNLRILDLSDNHLTSGKSLAKFKFQKLTIIGLSQNQIKNKSAFQAMHRCKTSKLLSSDLPQLEPDIQYLSHQFIAMRHNDYSSILKLQYESFQRQMTIWLPNISQNCLFKLGDKLNKSIEKKFNLSQIVYTQDQCMEQQNFESDQTPWFDDQ